MVRRCQVCKILDSFNSEFSSTASQRPAEDEYGYAFEVWRMPCRPSTSECGKGSEPHLIQSSTSLTSTASKAEEQILNWLKSLHHRKQRILWGLILDLKEFFYVSIKKKSNKHSSRMTRTDFRVSNVSLRTMQPVGLDPYRSTLPENEMLDFVILTKFTQDLTAYCNIYGVVPQRNLYKEPVTAQL
ncbi:hypothetical protein NQ317_007944 [Molorchus minor]|uniref:Uncharacterized protein n=1 Tax=Molorchus minor TaxID=1323400 RepID=A0ABQ9IQ88_9CUCU|nr:hypothetical protein NQ317_007944 [Molorchus minor]